MTPTNHTTNLELSKRLKELGLCQESLFYLVDIFPCFNDEVRVETKDSMEAHLEHCGLSNLAKGLARDKCYSAYLASELMKALPMGIIIYRDASQYYCGTRYYWKELKDKKGIDKIDEYATGDNPANALASLLIYLLENKIVDVETINNNYLKK